MTAFSGNISAPRNFRTPNLVFSKSSGDGGVSPVMRRRACSLIPGGLGGLGLFPPGGAVAGREIWLSNPWTLKNMVKHPLKTFYLTVSSIIQWHLINFLDKYAIRFLENFYWEWYTCNCKKYINWIQMLN